MTPQDQEAVERLTAKDGSTEMSGRASKSTEGVSLEVLKRRARSRIRSQIMDGRMVRPDGCSKCGAPERRGKDGRTLLQAHHHKGYLFPLEVEWLCVDCHRSETPCNPLRGEQAFTAKLTESAVIEIHRSTESSADLALKYGVTRGAVYQVRARKTWTVVPLPTAPTQSAGGTET